ncbi:hypothetical protein SPRG_05626 [Saprolegnia parasitica CBS 223.65]|uniref:Thioesterase domain-containing protein n=1 Tax=Saprolegnia parasitica (strain CBS 223.65) TaxID=695850 RepID=A0A067CG33_SAPPC|nr:hypothetical protein SPRG_05626 [Saprolegnia parasitica CBS 223.65]KDO29674.1 hypothetical protein SPRG_05626 [Saprolegnia parasitica CBS 223.65]|eukprot:XP_012199732.1 hypothetical protein SPRG_05626 [Saprolegnia parasitica CBS 223.65]
MTLHGLSTTALLALGPLCVYGTALGAVGCSHSLSAVLAGLSFFVFCDGWYFLDMAIYQLHLLVLPLPRKPRTDLVDTYIRHGRVSLGDIDRNGHCNNARYLRECGFGRRDFWRANGVWALLRAESGNLVVGAQTVRYRRELSLGQAFSLETRVLAWDDQAFYVEQRFVTRCEDGKQDFVHAIVYVKNNVLGRLRPSDLVAMVAPGLSPPPIPDEVQLWIESNAASSAALRPKSN